MDELELEARAKQKKALLGIVVVILMATVYLTMNLVAQIGDVQVNAPTNNWVPVAAQLTGARMERKRGRGICVTIDYSIQGQKYSEIVKSFIGRRDAEQLEAEWKKKSQLQAFSNKITKRVVVQRDQLLFTNWLSIWSTIACQLCVITAGIVLNVCLNSTFSNAATIKRHLRRASEKNLAKQSNESTDYKTVFLSRLTRHQVKTQGDTSASE